MSEKPFCLRSFSGVVHSLHEIRCLSCLKELYLIESRAVSLKVLEAVCLYRITMLHCSAARREHVVWLQTITVRTSAILQEDCTLEQQTDRAECLVHEFQPAVGRNAMRDGAAAARSECHLIYAEWEEWKRVISRRWADARIITDPRNLPMPASACGSSKPV